MQFWAVNWKVSISIDGELVGQAAPLDLLVRNWSCINKCEGRKKSFLIIDVPKENLRYLCVQLQLITLLAQIGCII